MSTRSCWPTARRGTASSIWSSGAARSPAPRSTSWSTCTSGCRRTCRWCAPRRRIRCWSAGCRGWWPGPGPRSPARMRRCGVSSPGSGRCPSPSWPTGRGGGGSASAVAFFIVAAIIGVWVAGNPEVQATIGTPTDIDAIGQPRLRVVLQRAPGGFVRAAGVGEQLVGRGPVHRLRVLLGLPIPYLLFQNAANLGVAAGLMFHAGKGDIFLGLLTPARAAGVDRGLPGRARQACGSAGRWCRPGDRPRGQVLAEQGRAVVSVAVGLVVVLLVSGLIEALVTPSPLPTFVRIAIGVRGRGRLPGLRRALRPQGRSGGGDGRRRRRPRRGADPLTGP